MDAYSTRDLNLIPGGQWEHIEVLEGIGDESDVAKWLTSQGWSGFMCLGDPEGSLSVSTWIRDPDDGPSEYLIEVSDGNRTAPYMKTDSLPCLMDMLGRWAPAVQAAAVTDLLRRLQDPVLSTYGLVEVIAGRAAVGTTDTADRLRRDQNTKEKRHR